MCRMECVRLSGRLMCVAGGHPCELTAGGAVTGGTGYREHTSFACPSPVSFGCERIRSQQPGAWAVGHERLLAGRSVQVGGDLSKLLASPQTCLRLCVPPSAGRPPPSRPGVCVSRKPVCPSLLSKEERGLAGVFPMTDGARCSWRNFLSDAASGPGHGSGSVCRHT